MMFLSFVDVWYVHLNIIHLHLGVNDLKPIGRIRLHLGRIHLYLVINIDTQA